MRDIALTPFKKLRKKETKAKLAGLDGSRVTLTGSADGRTVQGELALLWDPGHRMAIAVYAYTASKALTREERAFLDSLVIHAEGKAPAVPAAK